PQALHWARSWASVEALRKSEKVDRGYTYPGFRTTENDPAEVVRDLEQRVAHPKLPTDLAAVHRLPKTQRIAALIDALDEIYGSHGESTVIFGLYDGSISKALEAEGEEAIPALLEALSTEFRITRSARYQAYSPTRFVLPVQSFEWRILTNLWPSARVFTYTPVPEKWTRLTEEWATVSHLTEPQRWLRILSDDSAGVEKWLDAARVLTYRHNVDTKGWGTLVGLTGPEITALITRRARTILDQKPNWATGDYSLAKQSIEIARSLFRWDSKAGIPILVEAARKAVDPITNGGAQSEDARRILGSELNEVIIDLAKANRLEASHIFRRMTATITLRSTFEDGWFLALCNSSVQRDLELAGVALFDRLAKAAPYETSPNGTIASLITAPLLRVRSFRVFLAALLKNDVPAGLAWWEADELGNPPAIRFEQRHRELYNFALEDVTSIHIPKGQITMVSFGDFFAQKLSQAPGAPNFAMVWSAAERRAGKEALRRWLLNDLDR
ncbi:MAG: hypothetical protein K8R88_14400, partial [Armatimonadetes bacterium]|nr:hypothetical protein [Armatimonadota bacterium]